MSRRPVEKLSRALRRQAQIRSWQCTRKAESQPTAAAVAAMAASPVGNDARRPPFSLHKRTEGSLHSTAPAGSDRGDSIIQANHSLREALARGGPETRLTRQVRRAIEHSSGKADAMKAFQVLLQTDDETPTAATFKILASTLLQHHVEERVGHAAFQHALVDAVGSDSDRWKRLSEEERSTFVNYTCRTTERWAERGSSYNKLLGFSQEGTDNDTVTQVEYQMRKSGVTVSSATLADLMHLDVTWSTAVHLYEYSEEQHKVPPPMEMVDRLMGLMTGYKTGLGGSRPWKRALELYARALASGYELTLTTHTHALDALWRSADTFHHVRCTVSPAHQKMIWEKANEISQRVKAQQLLIAGEDGCAYAESLAKAFAASGRWSMAVSLLSDLDTSAEDASFRSLVPTAETYAFVMAACNAAGNASHGEAVWTIFRSTYTLRSLQSEVLVVLLQSFRHVVRTSPLVGSLVEELVMDGKGLERQAVVTSLQLLSSRHVRTKEPRWLLASKLLEMYDANSWPQQPLARKADLQTVFRCCHLIAAMEAANGRRLLTQLRQKLIDVFGADSAEVEWLDDTSVYALQTTSSWEEAINVYDAAVGRRTPGRVPYLPIPLRQAKTMLLTALLRCCKTMEEEGESFLVDEDTQEKGRDAAVVLAERALAMARAVYTADDTFPHNLYAELLLLRAQGAVKRSERKLHALEAMRHFSQASAILLNHHVIVRLAAALALTEVHVENALLEGHAALRCATFALPKDCRKTRTACGVFDTMTW
ncbi:hypothetical protein DQ04_06571050 [Trypanosoma grayi]|uniref:hypothetical protein n=1 Tax=Trypanosoma grayi TaxID=71804 RepID=UPI0004F42C4D|nr:hypothetical protein DQ04_06571050 [Trypanosoma grayi]KEG08723.1 hypothetical protein DQ04_06571050 [Trypanosoma grayi]